MGGVTSLVCRRFHQEGENRTNPKMRTNGSTHQEVKRIPMYSFLHAGGPLVRGWFLIPQLCRTHVYPLLGGCCSSSVSQQVAGGGETSGGREAVAIRRARLFEKFDLQLRDDGSKRPATQLPAGKAQEDLPRKSWSRYQGGGSGERILVEGCCCEINGVNLCSGCCSSRRRKFKMSTHQLVCPTQLSHPLRKLCLCLVQLF